MLLLYALMSFTTCKVNPNYALVVFLMAISVVGSMQPGKAAVQTLTHGQEARLTARDTLPVKPLGIPLKSSAGDTIKPSSSDSLKAGKLDTAGVSIVDTLNVRLSADTLDAPVEYQAEDSMVLDVDTRRILLYGKTEVKYTDVALTAPSLVFDQETNVVMARMGRDTVGNVTGMAKLVQAETTTTLVS